FQAEDGIRDFHVTGVQTCALPIYAFDDVALFVDGAIVVVLDLAILARWNDGGGAPLEKPFTQRLAVVSLVGDKLCGWRHRLDTRSEERRVGKEGRSRWLADVWNRK